jgi:hypothetical protein
MTDLVLEPDLRELLATKPELLAIADALIETQRSDDWPVPMPRQQRLRSGRRRRGYLIGVLALIAVALVASALAASGVNPFSAFKSWFSGSPGRPAPASAEQQFLAANGRSWAAFPTGTKLRVLIRASIGGKQYVLYGFRSGDSLCLRLSAVSLRTSLAPACAPVSTLEHTSVPILVVKGNGSVHAFPDRRSPEVSFGIVADRIRHVEVNAVDGTHRARIGGNAYLWIENEPNTANHVLSVVAVGDDAARTVVAVPHENGFGIFQMAPAASPGGPTRIQATIKHPAIGWLVHHRAVGLAPSQLALSTFARRQIAVWGFTRFVKPDPLSNVIVGVSDGRLYVNDGIAGGEFFTRGPLNVMTTGGNHANLSDQFVTVAGVAADGVSKIKIFLGSGQNQDVPLKDNVFTATVPWHTAARVVAYNSDGRVVGIQRAGLFPFGLGGFVAPAAARNSLEPVLRLAGPNDATARLSVGRTVEFIRSATRRSDRGPGVRCWRIDFSNGQSSSDCQQVYPTGPWVYVQGVQPVGRDVFIIGQTRAPVARVSLRFADGDSVSARPTRGIVILAVPRAHLSTHRQRAILLGYDARGHEIQHPAVFFRANG